MDKLRNRYVIGTHVMWFEIEMYADFIDGMVNLLETVENKENVTIDLCFNMLQHFEKVDYDKIKKHELVIKFKKVYPRWSLWDILSIKKSKMVMSFIFMLITEET